MWVTILVIIALISLVITLFSEARALNHNKQLLRIPDGGNGIYLIIFEDKSVALLYATYYSKPHEQLKSKLQKKLNDLSYIEKLQGKVGKTLSLKKIGKTKRTLYHGFSSYWNESSNWLGDTISEIPSDISALGALAVGLYVRVKWVSMRIMFAYSELTRNSAYAVLNPTMEQSMADDIKVVDYITSVGVSSPHNFTVIEM